MIRNTMATSISTVTLSLVVQPFTGKSKTTFCFVTRLDTCRQGMPKWKPAASFINDGGVRGLEGAYHRSGCPRTQQKVLHPTTTELLVKWAPNPPSCTIVADDGRILTLEGIHSFLITRHTCGPNSLGKSAEG